MSTLAPMLASSGESIPRGSGWTFEPKYDGVRVLGFARADRVSLTTRNGNDKSSQFPEIVAALKSLAKRRRASFVVDAEIVATREDGTLDRFQALQARLHQQDPARIAVDADTNPATLVGLDLLEHKSERLIDQPWTTRRKALEKLFRGTHLTTLRLGETHPDDGTGLMRRARAEGWEGIMAKRMNAPYAAGRRSSDWRKLKIEHRQEFVVGGWTEPRNSRLHIGALLLGVYNADGQFVYAGHTGTGFSQSDLSRLFAQLAPLEQRKPPFAKTPTTNAPAHWTRPEVVVEVQFNEWTKDGRLRQPVYLGVRDDKSPRDVYREVNREAHGDGTGAIMATGKTEKAIAALALRGGRGALALDRGTTIEVTNLGKTFFPESGFTKGDVMSYYAAIAPAILPLIEGRPLILKRFPNGIRGKSFFQQKAPAATPASVRVEMLDIGEDGPEARFVGGGLATLLHTVQLGAIEVHPWHSRVESIDDADYSIIDLDPGPDASFERVVQVARWVKETLDGLKLHGALKTSGSTGLHVYLPLPAGTSYETSVLIAQLVATQVADEHPREATIVRTVKKRASDAVYVDYLQNIQGKSVAGPFSVRAREPGRVSTPIDWSELTHSLDPAAFTMATVPAQMKERRALWRAALKRPIRIPRD